MVSPKSRLSLKKAPFLGKSGGSLFGKLPAKEKPAEEGKQAAAPGEEPAWQSQEKAGREEEGKQAQPDEAAGRKEEGKQAQPDEAAEREDAGKETAEAGGKPPEAAVEAGMEAPLKEGVDVPRIPTGVPGLDELVSGGIPKGSVILVAGGPGSGKSIFSLQFLLNGAQKYGEAGAYISMEEPEDSIRRTGEMFGWNVKELEKKGLFNVVWRDPYDVKSFAKTMGGQLYYLIRDANIKRIAFDSITYFTLTEENRFKLRKEIAELSTRLKAVGVTSLFVSEVPQAEIKKGRYGMEEFVADGIILLNNFLVRDQHIRAVEVLKMRHTHHDTLLHPFAITKHGLEIYPHELVFKD